MEFIKTAFITFFTVIALAIVGLVWLLAGPWPVLAMAGILAVTVFIVDPWLRKRYPWLF